MREGVVRLKKAVVQTLARYKTPLYVPNKVSPRMEDVLHHRHSTSCIPRSRSLSWASPRTARQRNGSRLANRYNVPRFYTQHTLTSLLPQQWRVYGSTFCLEDARATFEAVQEKKGAKSETKNLTWPDVIADLRAMW
jgi:hypothetical protein